MAQGPILGHKWAMEHKSTLAAYLLWFFFGLLGIHRFYLGHTGWGIAYLLTGGFIGIGWLVDLFMIPAYVVNYNHRIDHAMGGR